MRVVVLAGLRKGVPARDAAWAACRDRWARILPEAEIFEAHHDEGPFNKSLSQNWAAEDAGDWDIAVVVDGDVFVPSHQVRDAIRIAHETQKVTWAHTGWRGLTEESSAAMLSRVADWDGESVGELEVERPLSWSCVTVIPRSAWDRLGGFDERFRGWGYEDMAFKSAVVGLLGYERVEGFVYHLWHPRTPGIGRRAGRTQVDAVRNVRLGRRYMAAEARAMGKPDREQHWREDDAKYRDSWARLGQPSLDSWWPSLEELIEDAKEYRASQDVQTVTVAVHTDGRRDYILRSIPSLEEQLRGEIVKRVIYDDSGDESYKSWLRETFQRYKVVGPASRVGYTKSMSMLWSYLARRCWSKWVFLAEDDFLYDVPQDLSAMADILERNSYLRQIALLRHPFYPRELRAGSIIAEHPEAYEARISQRGKWLEHRLYFTANPSLFARSLCEREPWPSEGKSSEKLYTAHLNRDPRSRMAYLGHGEETITHIGEVRAGSGY